MAYNFECYKFKYPPSVVITKKFSLDFIDKLVVVVLVVAGLVVVNVTVVVVALVVVFVLVVEVVVEVVDVITNY